MKHKKIDNKELQLRPNNTSGVVGIAVLERPWGQYVRASWSGGVTEFSVRAHGRLGAVRMAMDARAKKAGVKFTESPHSVWRKINRKPS